jgi:hypothetical protein
VLKVTAHGLDEPAAQERHAGCAQSAGGEARDDVARIHFRRRAQHVGESPPNHSPSAAGASGAAKEKGGAIILVCLGLIAGLFCDDVAGWLFVGGVLAASLALVFVVIRAWGVEPGAAPSK